MGEFLVVVGHYGHAEEFVLPEDRLIPVPDGVSRGLAVAGPSEPLAARGAGRLAEGLPSDRASDR